MLASKAAVDSYGPSSLHGRYQAALRAVVERLESDALDTFYELRVAHDFLPAMGSRDVYFHRQEKISA